MTKAEQQAADYAREVENMDRYDLTEEIVGLGVLRGDNLHVREQAYILADFVAFVRDAGQDLSTEQFRRALQLAIERRG